jgi:hypothetical protein
MGLGEGMTEVYLHVGLPKAGSTFLQECCFPHLRGVHSVTSDSKSGLTSRLSRVAESYPLFVDMDEEKAEIDRFLGEVGDDKVLISSEKLVGYHAWGFRDHFQTTESLRHLFPSAKIIFVIRRQDEFLESVYRQLLKQCFYPTVDGFLGYSPKEMIYSRRRIGQGFAISPSPVIFPSVNVPRVDYYAIVRHYATTFGRRNIIVLPQEMLRNDPQRFHTELADFMGIEPYFSLMDTKVVNRAYSLLSCRIALLLNRFVRHPAHEKRPWRLIPHHPLTSYLYHRATHDRTYRLLDALNQRLSLRYVLENVVDRIHYRRGRLISDEKRRLIMEIHRESNRKLDKEFGLGLEEYGYY